MTKLDMILWGCFFGGQWLFVLKRAASAIRNPNKIILSRRDYVSHNWDILAIRGVLEAVVIFYPCRHFTLGQIVGFFGWSSSPAFLSAVPENPFAFVALGYAADSLLDWLSVSPKVPAFLRSFIQENVPDANNGNGAPSK